MLTGFLVTRKMPLTSSFGNISIRSMEKSMEIYATLPMFYHCQVQQLALLPSAHCSSDVLYITHFSQSQKLKDPDSLFKFPPYQQIQKQRGPRFLHSFLLLMDGISPTLICGKLSACSLGAHNFHSLSCILLFLSSIELFS